MSQFRQSLIPECEALIRAGLITKVVAQLNQINVAKVPREFRLPLANLARRSGLYFLGLSLLAHVIRPQRKNAAAAATSQELAEYAVLLIRVGGLAEAQMILEKVDAVQIPEADLYKAYCCFAQFNFDRAVGLLKTYLRAPLSDYSRLVGQVNLAFALVETGEYDSAMSTLDLLFAAPALSSRLKSNCHSLKARIELGSGRFSAARKELVAAENILGNSQTTDHFFIRKWQAFLLAQETGSSSPIDEFRLLAKENRDWDGFRECDYQALKLNDSQELFDRLIFGTPFESYRERICREFGRAPSAGTYLFGDSKADFQLEIQTGLFSPKQKALKPGSKNHKMIDVLLRDFYRPLNVVEIFLEVFPGEYFDIFSSPNRVHQLLHRTRGWIAKDHLPLEIRSEEGFYSLVSQGLSFRVPLRRNEGGTMALRFEAFRALMGQRTNFATRDVQQTMANFSRSGLKRLLHWGLESGLLRRVGESSETVYQFVDSQSETPKRIAA